MVEVLLAFRFEETGHGQVIMKRNQKEGKLEPEQKEENK